MHRTTLSGALAALALLTVAALPGIAAQPQLEVRSVGEIFVDAQGRASGQNVASLIAEREGVIEGFSATALGVEVFRQVRVDGFSQAEKIQGVGSSSLTLRGSNAVVTLHDNVHSILSVETTKPAVVRYVLGPDVSALQESPGRVSLAHATRGELGHLVAVGSEGEKPRGEAFQVKGDEIAASAQAGSELVFLAKPGAMRAPAQQSALVAALAQGRLASQFVSEFEGSEIATSQVDHGAAEVRTRADARGLVATTLRGAGDARVLAYDLAYESLPARAASDVAVYANGQLAARADSPGDVLARAKEGAASYHAVVQDGRTQVLASIPRGEGEHRITISASAQASTEPQARAEGSADEDARVYGGFERHANGKLTGEFVTSVLPEGRAQLLGFTALPARTEVFESITVDGAAEARFAGAGVDTMRIETPKADLTLVDDVHATIVLAARAPVEATYELATDIAARSDGASILVLEGPRGPAGALVLAGAPGASLSVSAGGSVAVHLVPGSFLVYRASPDAHESEPAVLRAIAEGAFAAQLLVGQQAGSVATKVTTHAEDARVAIRADGPARFVVELLASSDDAPRAFALDGRGAALVARSASDVRVTVDGLSASAVSTPEEVFSGLGFPVYHAATSLDGALRILVDAASATGQTATIVVESTVAEEARAQARTDAFGAFRVFHDGTAIGSFVTLKADQAAGAVTGLTMVATSQPVFASLAAGNSPFASMSGDASSVLRLENREARLEFSDTTSGFARISALAPTSAAFRLASTVHAEQRGPSVVGIVDASGAHIGSLVLLGAGTIEASERDVRAELGRGSTLLFRAHAGIESELSAAQRAMIDQAIAAGRVGAQVIVQTQSTIGADVRALESTARAEGDAIGTGAQKAYGELTSAVATSYGALSVATAATKSRVDITLASSLSAGQTLLVSLDPDTIPGMARGKASIRFDGEAVAQATSYADILDPDDDQGAPEYFVLAGDAGTQVLVSAPSSGVHTVTLEEQKDRPTSLYMWATAALGILVVVQGTLLARNARKNTIHNRRP